uniref:Scaffold attachment factor b n=1 Tax=Rhipicephalus appendiculatus TaxID=34631 RepID=A0A131Z0M0_RHIAP
MASAGDGSATVKRKISELKVVQLRAELEGRELDKSGSKTALVERLSKALEEEGLDPETYEFEVPAESSTTKKMSNEDTELGNEKSDVEKAPEVEPEPQTVDEAEEAEGEKEGSSEAMDADALQLSIEDEEKLLNEEEENFDKSKVLWERPPQRLRKQPKEMRRRWLHLPRVGEISG